MKMDSQIPEMMLAPCGINCYVCYAHVRPKNVCGGCRGAEEYMLKHCRQCAIKACAQNLGIDFCGDCPTFPCQRIKRLDKRYREKYHTSLIDNLQRMKTIGLPAYLIEEQAKWSCSACGGVISIHSRICSECGHALSDDA